jgi:hypothetical protein
VPGLTSNQQHPILNFEHADNFVLSYYAGGDTQHKSLPFTEVPEILSPGLLRGAPILNLSGEAQMLLVKVSESHDGRILLLGWGIQIGAGPFMRQWMYNKLPARERVALEDAIDELKSHQLLKADGSQAFRITTNGYRVADKIKQL